MIIEPGQFSYRLDELKKAFDLKASDVKGAVRIVYTHHRAGMEHAATLTKDGRGDTVEALRFIRRRTSVQIFDKDGKEVWSRVVPGADKESLAPVQSSRSKQNDHLLESTLHIEHPASEDDHT